MALPSFLGPFTPVASSAGSAQAPQVLPFIMQTQQQSNWCWAAMTASVCKFLGEVDLSEQCKVAHRWLLVDCCLNPMPTYGASWAGNQPYALLTALTDLNHTSDSPGGKLGFGDIVSQISNNNKPVCCHIKYTSESVGHFVAIIGYDTNGEKVVVRDPDKNSPHNGTFALSQMDATFGGTWDESYLVF